MPENEKQKHTRKPMLSSPDVVSEKKGLRNICEEALHAHPHLRTYECGSVLYVFAFPQGSVRGTRTIIMWHGTWIESRSCQARVWWV